LVGKLEERLQQAELVHDLQGRRMDRIAAEGPQEIRVLFQDDDADSSAPQQQPEHHPSGTAANNAATGGSLFHQGPPLPAPAQRAVSPILPENRKSPISPHWRPGQVEKKPFRFGS